MRAIYSAEGLPIPNASLEIAPPSIFKEGERVTFDDIGGHNQIKEVLRSLVCYARSGGMIRPIILAGPPGYGKTSLVRAFATQLEAPLIKKTSNDLPAEPTEANGSLS